MPVIQDEISLVKVSDGNDGKDGVAGKDGVGVAQTVISYAQAASGTTPPTSGWSTSVPALIKGQFLWTKTVWSYTDDTTEVGYTVSYNAKDGNDGDDGIAGKDGVGISNTKIEYVGSSSGTVKPTSGWSTTIPAVPEGSFLWTKTTWSYTDNTSEVGYSVAKMGAKGDQGIPGTPGTDGKDGANGQDAKEVISGYLSNESIIVPATAAGSVTDFSKAVGDFVVYEGQTKLSSGVTYSKVSETGMTSTINSAGRYTVTALSADVGTATYQAVYKSVTVQKIMIVVKNKQGATGPAGSNGTDGKGIVSSATTYQAGTSGTTPPNGTWSSSIPSVSENQYLWTRVVLTYSDNTTSTAYSVGKMGAKGETGATGSTGAPGATGNGIKSTTINFASSTSGTVAPSSG